MPVSSHESVGAAGSTLQYTGGHIALTPWICDHGTHQDAGTALRRLSKQPHGSMSLGSGILMLGGHPKQSPACMGLVGSKGGQVFKERTVQLGC